MADHNYTIVFQKLEEALRERPSAAEVGLEFAEADISEMEEIAELRRLVSEITEPEPSSFTLA